MATLPEADRVRVWRGLMRSWSRLREPLALNKLELRAAVDNTDVWIDDNQASFNAALPAAAQASLTSAQKTLLFCAVALARAGNEFLRRVFGGVD